MRERAKYLFIFFIHARKTQYSNTCRQNLAHRFINLKKHLLIGVEAEAPTTHVPKRSLNCAHRPCGAPFNLFAHVFAYRYDWEPDVANAPIKHLHFLCIVYVRRNANGHCRRCLLNFIFVSSNSVARTNWQPFDILYCVITRGFHMIREAHCTHTTSYDVM